jgi:hypothetical protein
MRFYRIFVTVLSGRFVNRFVNVRFDRLLHRLWDRLSD